jgi:DNA-binding response OmpR family regulator
MNDANPQMAAPDRLLDTMARRRILVVEDEASISEPLAAALEREGYATTVAETAGDALERFRETQPDLVLLDVMLPDGDGRDVLRQIRGMSRTPVLMVTARGEEMDTVVGLELGADDYIIKPFRSAELLARIRAVLRRSSTASAPSEPVLHVGDIDMNLDTRTASRAGEPLELTLKEFDLLRMLLEGAGRVVTRTDLMDEVWEPNWFGSTKTLDVHVSSLRKKLGDDPAEPRYIRTVRGVGFRFSSPEELAGSAG